jgi:hypothetical protein
MDEVQDTAPCAPYAPLDPLIPIDPVAPAVLAGSTGIAKLHYEVLPHAVSSHADRGCKTAPRMNCERILQAELGQ